MSKIYCIDTCSLVEARKIHYPPSVPVFKNLWDQFEESIKNGNIISSELVYKELEVQADEVFSWAKNQRDMFIKVDESIAKEAKEIIQNFEKLIDPSADREQADPYLIALAKLKKATVVTQEKFTHSEKKLKIPNVCQALDVQYMRINEMIVDIGWN